MGMLLSHMDLMPLFYGIIMFLGLWSMYHKFTHGRWAGFFIEVSVFALVFWLHGGTMNGGFAAMVCALIAGSVLPRTRRMK